MSEQTTTKASPSPRFSLDKFAIDKFAIDKFAIDTWAVAASVLFIALVVAGIFPRVPW
jgi:hypothetical protein